MVALKPYTRAVAKEYRKILFKNMEVSSDMENIKPDMASVEDAKDFLVISLTGKSQKQIDEMNPKEFEEIYSKCCEHVWFDNEEKIQKN